MATNIQPVAALEDGRRLSGRRRLDRLVGRPTVHWLLTLGILAGYVGMAIILRALMPENLPYAIALLATGAGALVALPMRDRLQRTVDRVMYGDRDEPYRALARLGSQLEMSIEPEAVPRAVVEAVAAALRAPYVAIEPLDGAQLPEASFGHAPAGLGPADLLRLAVVHRGTPVGSLVLAPRAAGERYDQADLDLLADLARQAAPAIEAARLTADLRRSRLRLVTAREEERRRLRRDLHDGLGPTLAGMMLKMEAARATLGEDPGDARQILGELSAGAKRAVEEVRRLTYDLRPPALDELGLVGALREQAAAFASGPERLLRITIDVPTPLPTLPAAVEVAAYRIGVEALTNVARHSGARAGTLLIAAQGGDLTIEVTDNGRGVGAALAGVGMRSMRERAEELGGSLEVEALPGGDGTRVRARLPLREPS